VLTLSNEKIEKLKELAKQFNDNGYIESVNFDDLEVMNWAVKQAEKVSKLEQSNKEITSKYIKILISNLELMDEHYPDWRLFAEKEIKQLKGLLLK
jgi:hypothetical protein